MESFHKSNKKSNLLIPKEHGLYYDQSNHFLQKPKICPGKLAKNSKVSLSLFISLWESFLEAANFLLSLEKK